MKAVAFLPLVVVTSSAALLPGLAANADVRVAHLSPDTPAVDVFFNAAGASDALLLDGVTYPQLSGYVPVATGNYDIRVALDASPFGTAIDVEGAALDGMTDYTIAAVGFSGGATPAIAPLVLVDDRDVLPDKAKLRAIHASPDAGAVDVRLQGPGGFDVTVNFEFTETIGYLELDPGAYDVSVLKGGELVGTFPVELSAGTNYSAFAIGSIAPGAANGFTLLPVVDAVPEPASLSLMALTGAMLLRRRR